MPATQLAKDFVDTFNTVILFPTIALLTTVALLIFIYGCFEYIVKSTDASAREQGVKHITWGIVGLVVMLSAYAMLTIAAGTFGLGGTLDCADDPLASGCDGEVVPVPVNNSAPGDDSVNIGRGES